MPLLQMNLKVILRQRKVSSVEIDRDGVPKDEEKAKEVKKCLFGPSNPEDTRKMLDEQFQKDRKRFIEKFDIDILDFEGDGEVKENGKVRASRKRRSAENVLKPYNKQARLLTDIYQIRKRCQAIVKDKEEV